MTIVMVLAGGKSRRFGTNKALARFMGKTFLERVMEAVIGAVEYAEIVVSVTGDTPGKVIELARRYGASVVGDADLPCGGPPRAIASLAEANRGVDDLLVVGVDYPFITSNTINKFILKSKGENCKAATVMLEKGYPLVTFGYLAKDTLHYIAKVCRIKKSSTRLTDAYRGATPLCIYSWDHFTPNKKEFLNVNTPSDLKRAPASKPMKYSLKIHGYHHRKYIECLDSGDIRCARESLADEITLYEKNSLTLFSIHAIKDLKRLEQLGGPRGL